MSSLADSSSATSINENKWEKHFTELVKYNEMARQKRHRREPRQKCQERAARLFDEKMFADPPPKEECPICFLPMPYAPNESFYQACCGKSICSGCQFGALRAAAKTGTSWSRVVSDDKCPFCRATEGDLLVRLEKRMSVGDAEAIRNLAGIHSEGRYGIPQNARKAFELLSKSADLGSIEAHYHLGVAYQDGEGVGIDLVKAKYHYEIAAIGGNDHARGNLGVLEAESENFPRAMKHWMISAMRGHDEPLENLKKIYVMGYLSKDDLEKALRAHKDSQDDMKSEQRDWAKDHWDAAGRRHIIG